MARLLVAVCWTSCSVMGVARHARAMVQSFNTTARRVDVDTLAATAAQVDSAVLAGECIFDVYDSDQLTASPGGVTKKPGSTTNWNTGSAARTSVALSNDTEMTVTFTAPMETEVMVGLVGPDYPTTGTYSSSCRWLTHAIFVDDSNDYCVAYEGHYDGSYAPGAYIGYSPKLCTRDASSVHTLTLSHGTVTYATDGVVWYTSTKTNQDWPVYVGVSLKSAYPNTFNALCSPTAQPAPTPAVSATGDPHLQNIHGQRFDLMRPGKAVLIQIPRGQPFEKSLLTVVADARRMGSHCADMYFQSVNITGAWADKVRPGGLTFTAGGSRDETVQAAQGWTRFGPLKLKVVHGSTSQGIKYFNFYVKHLMEVDAAIGGLLGEDDYTEAATPEEGCRKSISLHKNAISNSDVGRAEAIASLA